MRRWGAGHSASPHGAKLPAGGTSGPAVPSARPRGDRARSSGVGSKGVWWDRRAALGRLQRLDNGDTNGWNRHILPVRARPGEGHLAEPIADVQPAGRELVFMPRSGHRLELPNRAEAVIRRAFL